MSNEQGQDTAVPTQPPATAPIRDTNVVEPENALPEVRAEDLPENWRAAMARAGLTNLMPVQAKAMPYIMAGRDLMVQARTGSGKTGAFVMPILERINPLHIIVVGLVAIFLLVLSLIAVVNWVV